MAKSSPERIADKIVDLLADGKVKKADWRLWIPRRILDDTTMETVVANAKHLADGINEVIDREEIGIAPHNSLDYIVRNMEDGTD